MKKNSIIFLIAIIVVALGIWIYSSSGSNSSQTSQATNELFSNSPLSKNAYLISTSTYDDNTKKALAGFSVTKNNLPDGSTQITLKAENPEYQTQTYTVKPGEKLYFIENSMSDDTNNTEKFIGDDHAVLVDANGYIVN